MVEVPCRPQYKNPERSGFLALVKVTNTNLVEDTDPIELDKIEHIEQSSYIELITEVDNARINRLRRNIKLLRKRHKYSMQDMSYFLQLRGRSAYSAYETGHAEPNIESLLVMSAIFQVSIDDMITADPVLSKIHYYPR